MISLGLIASDIDGTHFYFTLFHFIDHMVQSHVVWLNQDRGSLLHVGHMVCFMWSVRPEKEYILHFRIPGIIHG